MSSTGTTSQAAAIRAAAQRFYRLVRKDLRLAPYLAGSDIDALADRLAAHLIGTLRTHEDHGWPIDLIAEHRRPVLDEDAYDLLGHLLLTTLLPLRLGPDLLIRVGADLAAARSQAVTPVTGRDEQQVVRPRPEWRADGTRASPPADR